MIDESEYRNAGDWLARAARPLLVSHRGPDGDALGSLCALARALRKRQAEPAVALFDPFPPRYTFLRESITWYDWEQSRDVLARDCDALVILDTCALVQLEPFFKDFGGVPPTLVIDHHATRDPIGTRNEDLQLFDETAGATALLIAEWTQTVGVELDADIATALFTGIATDCGWFRFPNTDDRMLSMAAELVAAGAPLATVYDAIYQQERPARLQLIGRMLQSLETHANGELAVMYLRKADLEACGADRSMRDNLVNEAGRLAGTDVTILFTEDDDGLRVNFRSKRRLDVAQLAARYGGGGHARAAGARPNGAWDSVVPRIVAETIGALGGDG